MNTEQNDATSQPGEVRSSGGLGLAPERSFALWSFKQQDFTTQHPWDVARAAYLAGMAAERERWQAACAAAKANYSGSADAANALNDACFAAIGA
jgi:hypothetical protein